MLFSVINSLRVFKGLYDLAFSEDQFYVEQRAEFLGGVQLCIEQAKEGYHNPPQTAGIGQNTVQGVAGHLNVCLVPGRADRRPLGTQRTPRS
jgi:hypothetical protein